MPPVQPLDPYVPLAISIGIAVVFSLAFVGLSKWFGPHRPSPTKVSLYECGMPSLMPAHQRFSVKFYLVAVLFILFDLEAVFVYPWAVSFRSLIAADTVYVLAEMFVFLGVLALGWFYCLKRGALRWD